MGKPFTMRVCARWALCCSALCLAVAGAEELRFDSEQMWGAWPIPPGMVQFDAEGTMRLVYFNSQIDAVPDAGTHLHQTRERGEVWGGIWQAGSNRSGAVRVIDGDLETFWQPDPDDGVRNWIIEIDLGRVVLAQEVVLRFPDRAGARPFSQFDVLVGSGARFRGRSDDVFVHREVYATSLPNKETEIRIPLSYEVGDTLRALDPQADLSAARHFLPVQYVRLEATELSEDAALAEIEVRAMGGNIAPGTVSRGGAIRGGERANSLPNAVDGDMDTRVSLRGGFIEESWRASGMWLELDLGATFWVDRIFLSPMRPGFALSATQQLLRENENAGLELLLSEGETSTTYQHFFYVFQPRKIRSLILHALDGREWGRGLDELMIHALGHPAQVVLRSDFIDLGQIDGDNRYKAISQLSWDAELPQNTRIQLRSRSGNTLRQEHTFYDRSGNVVSQRSWLSAPRVLRGRIDSIVVAGGDWDEWSNIYQLSGEPFKSETPARFVQLEAILSTEDPERTPVLRSLSLHYSDALVQQVSGQVLPRQVAANSDEEFSYVVWAQGNDGDRGFDRLRLAVPERVAAEGVAIEVGGKLVEPLELFTQADSLLFVTLPEVVRDDSVRIVFNARVFRNATLFSMHLGHTQEPGIWQTVAPLQRHADVVFLPELVGRRELIGDLQIEPAIFSPNGDGVNDQVEIRFAVFNAEVVAPQVRIFDLSGRLVAELVRGGGRERMVFGWDGRDEKGQRVPPGLYLCDIDLGAAAGDGRATRSLAVVY